MKHYNAAYVWSICLVAALGGLLFGYDWVVISGANIFYEKYFNFDFILRCRLGEKLRPGRLPAGRRALRGAERPLRAEAAARLGGGPVHRLLAGHRPGRHIPHLRRLADHRRHGHRAGLESVADVYRRSVAGGDSRQAGVSQSVHDCLRHCVGPVQQLLHCQAGSA